MTIKTMAAAGLLVLLAASAFAQGSSLGWGQKPIPVQSGPNPQGQLKIGIVGGVKSDSSAVPFMFDTGTGAFKMIDADRDRDYSTLTNLLNIPGTLTSGQSKVALMPIDLSKYGKIDVMISYNTGAAADSDSVNIALKFWAMTSTTSGNKYLLTRMPSDSMATYLLAGYHGAFAPTTADSSNYFIDLSAYVTRNGKRCLQGRQPGVVDAGYPRCSCWIPKPLWVFGSPTAAQFSLTTQGINESERAQCQYLLVEVANLNTSQDLSQVTVDAWPRVQ